MDSAIHTTMDRLELLTAEAQPVVRELDALVRSMYSRGVYPGSWYGTVPPPPFSGENLRYLVARVLRRPHTEYWRVGFEVRDGHYEPLPGAADDGRLPWYQYWQVVWAVLRGPTVAPGMAVLDAGGASSLLSCLLASRGVAVHGIDIDPRLARNAKRIARVMGWPMQASVMAVEHLSFPARHFDHAYAIGLFHHLSEQRRAEALTRFHECLKPGGQLVATFDYRNPAPYEVERLEYIDGQGLVSEHDIQRTFVAGGRFRLGGDGRFVDRGVLPLVHEARADVRYTFAGIALAKIEYP
ncbi:MAG: class I SAM-dependent methyltransferase [Betaproteobacteria bacterium]